MVGTYTSKLEPVLPHASKIAPIAADAIATRQAEESLRALRRQEEREAKFTEQLRVLMEHLATEIPQAASEGKTSYFISMDGEEEELASILRRELRELGYETNWAKETVDHGDSAAPCVREEIHMTIQWM
jgi:hypothetical protein